MMRSVVANMFTFLIVGLAILAGAIFWGQRTFVEQGPLAEAICFSVPSGTNIGRVAEDLAEQGAVESATLFRVGSNYTGRSGSLKAGNFTIPAGASMDEILSDITRSGPSTCGTEINYRVGVTSIEALAREIDPETGNYVEVATYDMAAEEPEIPEEYTAIADSEVTPRYRITMAEGVTSWQVLQALQAIPFLEGEVTETPDEGTLAPASYEIREGDTRAEVIERMQASQASQLAEAWEGRDPDLPLESAEELLILASIVEKETGVAAERPQVASVFANRLRDGMRLQTDPTVIYGITNGEGTLGRGLRRSELDAATPYNTYQIDGLPPTPIANPGREAILAAANPDETPYFYFVADGTGGHAFAETLDEHNENVARWREIEAQQNQ
ncbi:endolytic transglycosylase MltG [Roseobacter sp. HKCCA0434]|uniref:endolytic transglycosylase MltG n=1 Tax=Roseobacter sp. HKCCA0434 TaxID=3079297 RepID=UPI002905D24F|nr:endolytic transglycosylase MltG [Roseobacter sp. HKCCA0434]